MTNLYAVLLFRQLDRIAKDNERMTPALQALAEQVSANTAVVNSAVALIKGLADAMQASKDDPAAIAALTAEIHAASDALGSAVAANTPATPAPAEAPAPEAPAPEVPATT